MIRGKSKEKLNNFITTINVLQGKPVLLFKEANRFNVGHIDYSNSGNRYYLYQTVNEQGAERDISTYYFASQFLSFVEGFVEGLKATTKS